MDEADLLADHIAVLAAPGKLVTQGSPVTLKREFGKGYNIQVTFDAQQDTEKVTAPRKDLYQRLLTIAHHVKASIISPLQTLYLLNTRDTQVVADVLHFLDEEKLHYCIKSYDVLGTSMEDVFLGLMSTNDTTPEADSHDTSVLMSEKSLEDAEDRMMPLSSLSHGRHPHIFQQATTIFHKRSLILRRSWLSPLLTILVAVMGSTIPMIFIDKGAQTCTRLLWDMPIVPLYLPATSFPPSVVDILDSPPGIVSSLGNTTSSLILDNVPNNATFVNTIYSDYRNISAGGVSFDVTTGGSLVAWEASPPGLMGPSMLNLATNILYNRALNTSRHGQNTPTIISPNYQSLPAPNSRSLNSLKWVGFYGAAMVGCELCKIVIDL